LVRRWKERKEGGYWQWLSAEIEAELSMSWSIDVQGGENEDG
jgi:hypothetical protein